MRSGMLTGTDDIQSQMREQITSTVLHVDAFRTVAMPTNNADTQVWLTCNDAGKLYTGLVLFMCTQ